MTLNSERGPLVQEPCVCRGRNGTCEMCDGLGVRSHKSCRRCGGTGSEGGGSRCVDCRGRGWRELDQPVRD